MEHLRSQFSVRGSRFVFRFVFRFGFGFRFGVRFVLAAGVLLFVQDTAAAQGNTGAAAYAKAGCETCHGPGGRGTAAGPAIAGTTRALPAFVAYVRKPLGTMPPQSAQTVPDQVLADIYAFLRAAAPAPASAPGTPAAPPGRAQYTYRPAGQQQSGEMLRKFRPGPAVDVPRPGSYDVVFHLRPRLSD